MFNNQLDSVSSHELSEKITNFKLQFYIKICSFYSIFLQFNVCFIKSVTLLTEVSIIDIEIFVNS